MNEQLTTDAGKPVTSVHLPGAAPFLIDDLVSLTERVDALLLQHYNNGEGIGVERKVDSSPVTRADRDAHELIFAGLTSLTPDIPILSEESPAEQIGDRLDWQRCWIVDPLDGTKEFIGRTGEFTINIALVDQGRPVLGLLSVPVQGQCYVGIPGQGAWCLGPANGAGLRAARLLQVQTLSPHSPLRVLASARHNADRVAAVMSKLDRVGAGTQRINAGSALKFCALLETEADIYPRTSPCYEWDVAAGDALVTAAGGFVVDTEGVPLRYNQRHSLLVERFIAGADDSIDWPGLLHP